MWRIKNKFSLLMFSYLVCTFLAKVVFKQSIERFQNLVTVRTILDTLVSYENTSY
jgi:hypothetical protein